MKFGMNLLMYTDTLSEDQLPLLESLKEWGFDAAEMPIFDNDVENAARWGKRLDELELSRTATAIRLLDDNPMSSDPTVRRLGIDANKKTVDCCAAMGCEVMAGPFHSAIGHFSGKGPTEDEWKWAVDSMREVAEHAETCNVKLAMEAINRFECYLMNCMADATRFARDVDHPYCGVMYDTFHANLEEKNVTEAIRESSCCLFHVHISENDRSTPGQGAVRWDETFDALKEVGYDGFLVIEAFGLALEKISAATKIWRRMYESEEQLAKDGLAFMKAEVARRW